MKLITIVITCAMIFFPYLSLLSNYCNLCEGRGLIDLVHSSMSGVQLPRKLLTHKYFLKNIPSSYNISQTYRGQAQTYMVSCGLCITPPSHFLGEAMQGQRADRFCRARSSHPGLVGQAAQS